MGQKLVVGPFNRGLRNDVTAFNVDNESFPTLINAYQWRGRIKRKRGTSFLGRLTRFFNSTNPSYNPGAFLTVPTSSQTITLQAVTGAGNLLTSFPSASGFNLQVNGNIVPGSVTITVGVNTYTDVTEDGYLTPTGTGGINTINYASGEIAIPGEAGNNASAVFRYYPVLPVMGLEDFILVSTLYPLTIAFDTKYSYAIDNTDPYAIHDVSFYKNVASTVINGINYTQKTNPTPVTWNGQDYQQFWTVNYQGALWATNGINVPFIPGNSNTGMQFQIPNSATRDRADSNDIFNI